MPWIIVASLSKGRVAWHTNDVSFNQWWIISQKLLLPSSVCCCQLCRSEAYWDVVEFPQLKFVFVVFFVMEPNIFRWNACDGMLPLRLIIWKIAYFADGMEGGAIQKPPQYYRYCRRRIEPAEQKLRAQQRWSWKWREKSNPRRTSPIGISTKRNILGWGCFWGTLGMRRIIPVHVDLIH